MSRSRTAPPRLRKECCAHGSPPSDREFRKVEKPTSALHCVEWGQSASYPRSGAHGYAKPIPEADTVRGKGSPAEGSPAEGSATATNRPGQRKKWAGPFGPTHSRVELCLCLAATSHEDSCNAEAGDEGCNCGPDACVLAHTRVGQNGSVSTN